MQLSRHFALAELTHSNTAVARGIANQPDATQQARLQALCENVLDPLRDAIGRPLRVTSGFRSAALNAAIPGSSPTSQHSLGEAADLQCPGLNTATLFKTVIRLALPFDQLIYEAKNASTIWVHVSHRAGANRGQLLIAHFLANGKVRYSAVTAEEALAIPEATRSLMVEPDPGYEERADEPPQPARRAPRKPAATARSKKAAAKPSPATKTLAQKAAAKKAPPKPAPAKQPPAPKASSRKAAAKKVSAKPAAARTAPAKTAPAKKAPAKKAPAKKATVAKTASKATPAKKSVATRAPARKAAARKARTG